MHNWFIPGRAGNQAEQVELLVFLIFYGLSGLPNITARNVQSLNGRGALW